MNLCRVGVGATVAVAAGGCVAGAGGCVALGASVVGAAVGAGIAVGTGVGAGICVGAGVDTGAAGAGVSSSSPPHATITIAISATIDSRPNICHLFSHIGDFIYSPPAVFQNRTNSRQAAPPAWKQ